MPPLPQIGNATVKCGFVYPNDRVEPNPKFWDVPTGTVLVITRHCGPEPWAGRCRSDRIYEVLYNSTEWFRRVFSHRGKRHIEFALHDWHTSLR
jgi:hypothetical protein